MNFKTKFFTLFLSVAIFYFGIQVVDFMNFRMSLENKVSAFSDSVYSEDEITKNFNVESNTIRVKLSTPQLDLYKIQSSNLLRIESTYKGETKYIESNNLSIKSLNNSLFHLKFKNGNALAENVRVKSTDYVEIKNWNRIPAWDSKGEWNDNKFAGVLEFYSKNSETLVINELSLEDYMKGIAEVPEADNNEKRKALAILSRSYAAHYFLTENRKFPGENYDASDDPKVFQKYLGYSFSLRSPKWQQALKDTKDMILIHQNSVLRPAYSSCSDLSGYRKIPEEAGWNSEYFNSLNGVYTKVADHLGVDPIRAQNNTCGHGVGLSGKGATELGNKGKNFIEIINYYYKNTEIERLKI